MKKNNVKRIKKTLGQVAEGFRTVQRGAAFLQRKRREFYSAHPEARTYNVASLLGVQKVQRKKSVADTLLG